MRIVILGVPSAGIGTQAKILSKRLGVPALSPGEMLRDAVGGIGPGGLAAKLALDGHTFVDDDTMLAIVIERIGKPDAQHGFVLHGFPETVRQAVAIDETLRQHKLRLDAVIELAVQPHSESNRAKAEISYKGPAPVANYYWNQQRLIVLDGFRDHSATGKEIYAALELGHIV